MIIGSGTARSREMGFPVTRDILSLLPLVQVKEKRGPQGAVPRALAALFEITPPGVDVARSYFGWVGPTSVFSELRVAPAALRVK